MYRTGFVCIFTDYFTGSMIPVMTLDGLVDDSDEMLEEAVVLPSVSSPAATDTGTASI